MWREGRCVWLALAVLLTSIARVHAADRGWSVRTWQLDDGLPSESVSAIAQAPDGYLWIATWSGLARFDGAHFEKYDLSQLPGLRNMMAWSLLPSHSGGLWVGMDGGAVVFLKPNCPPRIFIEHHPLACVNEMVEDNQGTLWIVYRNGSICHIVDGNLTTLGTEHHFPDATTASLAADSDGRVWATRGRRLGKIDNEFFEDVAELSNGTIHMAPAKDGGLWICEGLNVDKYSEAKGLRTLGRIAVSGTGRDEAIPFEDRSGRLWIATSESGLFLYDGMAFENVATPQPRIFCLADDREDNLWLGTIAGLDRVQQRAIELEGGEVGLPFGTVNSICQDHDEQLWACTADGKILMRQDGRWTTSPVEIFDVPQCIVADASSGIWIGARSHAGLYHWSNGHLARMNLGLASARGTIRALLVSRGGDVWFGSTAPDSLRCLQNDQIVDVLLRPSIGFLDALAEAANGDIWVGFDKGGLLRIDGRTHLVAEAPEVQKPVRCLYVTPDNNLWIGYRSDGLGRLKNGRLSTVTKQQGLYEDTICQIISDDQGWLWLGGDHGISRVRLKELNDLSDGKIDCVHSFHYGADQGLPRLHARSSASPSASRSSDGRLWMPMETALAIVTPNRVCEQPIPPPVQIQRVLIDDRPIAFSTNIAADGLTLDRPSTSALELPPNYRQLEFDFTALAFSSPEGTRFRYRLDDFDEVWNEISEPRRARYPRLPAGNYRFHVIAGNADGIWNDQGATASIMVAPFIWQRWWFQAAAVTAFAASLLMLARYVSFRRLRQRLQVLEQRTALDRERARIARDLHDDLGHGLTQIVLLSDLTRHDNPSTLELDNQLRQIAATARTGIKSLDETVWAINPRNDTLPDVIDYLAQFVMESLRSAEIRCQLDLPDHPPVLNVPFEVRHSLFLAVKEAVNNILRHAHARNVALTIALDTPAIVITIADDGRGFDTSIKQSGQDGLRNIIQRMLEIGGSCYIQSAVGKGTRIRVTLPITSSEKNGYATVENTNSDANQSINR